MYEISGHLSISSRKGNDCCGIVTPKTYSNWVETKPQILLFEGIHQFCVKAVKNVFPLRAHIQFVPVQLKNVYLVNNIKYDEFKITGNVMKVGDMLVVEFTATKKIIAK